MKKKWRRKVFAAVLSGVLAASSLTLSVHIAQAATFEQVNQSTVFLKQPTGSSTCTLVSATMLVRRAAMLKGSTTWAEITTDVMTSAAWVSGVGLKWNFNCSGIDVERQTFSGSEYDLAKLLLEHPEGVIIYDRSLPHAILVTDYTDGIFYCADPSPAADSGRIPISDATVTVEGADDIWLVKSPALNLTDANGNIISRNDVDLDGFSTATPAPSATAKTTSTPKASSTPKATSTAKVKTVVKAPKKVSGVKVKNKAKKSVNVSWKKVSAAKGYEILYADNVRFKRYSYVYLQSKKHNLTNLTKGKKYYVKVRAYKSNGKELVYGKWSAVKKAKVKK